MNDVSDVVSYNMCSLRVWLAVGGEVCWQLWWCWLIVVCKSLAETHAACKQKTRALCSVKLVVMQATSWQISELSTIHYMPATNHTCNDYTYVDMYTLW